MYRYDRGQVFRYGKRRSVFRYGKRAEDTQDASPWKRDDSSSYGLKRKVFRWGKRSESEDGQLRAELESALAEALRDKRMSVDDLYKTNPMFRYSRARVDSPHVPFRFGDEE